MRACLIVDVTGSDQWSTGFGTLQRIPEAKRPTVLQVSREAAEAEAVRLCKAHPDCIFAIFEALEAVKSTRVPTHITLGGQVIGERSIPIITSLDEVPF